MEGKTVVQSVNHDTSPLTIVKTKAHGIAILSSHPHSGNTMPNGHCNAHFLIIVEKGQARKYAIFSLLGFCRAFPSARNSSDYTELWGENGLPYSLLNFKLDRGLWFSAFQTLMCMQITWGSCENEGTDSVGLGWDPRFYSSQKIQVTTMPLVQGKPACRCPFIHFLNRCLLSAYNGLGTVLDIEAAPVNGTE